MLVVYEVTVFSYVWFIKHRIVLVLVIASGLLFGLLAPSDPLFEPWLLELAGAMGVEPFRSWSTPIWSWLMAKLAEAGVAPIVGWASGVSVIFGVLTTVLIFEAVRRLPYSPRGGVSDNREIERSCRVVGGLIAAGFLGLSAPMLSGASRPEPGVIGAWFIAVLFVVMVAGLKRPGRWLRRLLLVVLGVGLSESAGVFALTPAGLVAWLVMLWREVRRDKTKRPADRRWVRFAGKAAREGVWFLAAVILGWAWVLIEAQAHPSWLWMGKDSTGDVLQALVQSQVRWVSGALTPSGWLLLLGLNILPILLVLRRVDDPDDGITRWGTAMFRTVLMMVALLSFLPLPVTILPVYPAPLLPMVFTAVWFGYIAGVVRYHLLQRGHHWRGSLVTTGLVVVIGIGGVFNMMEVWRSRPTSTGLILRELADSMADRQIWLAQGLLGTALAVTAHDLDLNPLIVDISLDSSSAYRGYLAARRGDPKEASLLDVGVGPWLRDRIRDPLVREDLAVIDSPHQAWSHGVHPVPHFGWYEWRADGAEPDSFILQREMAESWMIVSELSSITPRLGQLLGRSANDLGVLFLRQNHLSEAIHWLDVALTLQPDSVHARINRLVAEQIGENEVTRRLRSELDDLRGQGRRGSLHREGWVHDPEHYRALSLTLARRGASASASAWLEAARKAGGPPMSLELTQARLHQADGDIAQSEQTLLALAERDPADADVVYELYRHYRTSGQPDVAEVWLTRLEALLPLAEWTVFERAMLAMDRMQWTEAEDMLRGVAQARQHREEAWLWLAYLAEIGGKEGLAQEANRALTEFPNYLPGQLVLADVSLQRGQVEVARQQLERLHQRWPSEPVILERLLSLAFMEERWDDANGWSRALARLDPDHPWVQLIRGYALHHQGQVAEAKVAFELSLKHGERAMAHHALAMIYHDRKNWAQALVHADRAVALESSHPVYHATRGMIRAQAGDAAGALIDYRHALTSGGRVLPGIALNAASLLMDFGFAEEASSLLDGLNRDQLTPAERDHLAELERRFGIEPDRD